MPEFDILNNVIDYMESTGSTYKTVTLSIDEDLVDQLNASNGTSYTLSDIEKATDKCLAYDWLERIAIGGGYASLRITSKGVGAARSKRKSEQVEASRSYLKNMSDYIEDHKGLFIVLGFLLALATFGMKIFGSDS